MNAAFFYDLNRLMPEKKLCMLLSPIHRNYLKIIINNGSSSDTTADAKESTDYQVMLQYTLALVKH